MNKLYDIVLQKYTEYNEYNEFLEQEKLRLKDARKELLKKVLEENLETEEVHISDEVQEKLFDFQTEEKIYSQDAQMLFYNLYNLVETYQSLEDMMVLPKEVLELCETLNYLVPKTIFVIEAGKPKEREKGKLEEIKNPFYKNQQLKIFKDSLIPQIKEMIKTNTASD